MNMKLKFFIAGVAIVAGLASAVSCQDLSKDLTALQNKVNSLESTVQALQSKIDAGAVITSVTPSNSGIKITLSNGNSYEITNGVNGKDGANGKDGKDGKDGADGTPGSVVTIGENGNWFIDGVDTGLAAEGKDGADGADGADGTPGMFFVPNPETGCFDMYVWDEEKGEYVAQATEIPFVTPGTITAVYNPLTGVVTLYGIEGYEGGYEIGPGASGVTAIEVQDLGMGLWNDLDLDLFKVIAAKDYVFGTELKDIPAYKGIVVANPVTFTKGAEQERIASFIVRVSPTAYQLKPEDISFINSQGKSLDYVVVESVEPYTELLTKGYDNGLWKVTVSMDKDSEKEYKKAIVDEEGNDILFAVKAGEAVSSYQLAFYRTNYMPTDPLYNGDYSKWNPDYDDPFRSRIFVNGVDIVPNPILGTPGTKNRITADFTEYVWKAPSKTAWLPTTTIVKESADPKNDNVQAGDNRVAADYIQIKASSTIKIEWDTKQYKAAYVVLDLPNAETISDDSEAEAWKRYNYSGLNEISETGMIKLKINEPDLYDIIGFRVFVVNWDGTLADPDGIAFYVTIGGTEEVEEWETTGVANIVPVYNGSFGTGDDESDLIALTGATKLAKAASVLVEMDDLLTFAPGEDPQIGVNFYSVNAKGTPVLVGFVEPDGTCVNPADWSKVKYVSAYTFDDGVNDYQSWADGIEYPATVTVLDNLGYPLASFGVTAKKTYPTAAPAEAIAAFKPKTNALIEGVHAIYAEGLPYVLVDNTDAPYGGAGAWNAYIAAANALNAKNLLKSTVPTTDTVVEEFNLYDAVYVDDAIDFSKIFELELPTTGAVTSLADYRTSMPGIVPTYTPATATAKHKFTQEPITFWNTPAAAAYNVSNRYFDGSERTVTVDYWYGPISAKQVKNAYGEVTGVVPETAANKQGYLPAATFKVKLSTWAREAEYDWNWNMMQENSALAAAKAEPKTAWQINAPGHNARLNYNNTGVAALPESPIAVLTPAVAVAYPAWDITYNTVGDPTNKYSDDPFKVNAPLQLYYNAALPATAFDLGDWVYVSSKLKKTWNGYLNPTGTLTPSTNIIYGAANNFNFTDNAAEANAISLNWKGDAQPAVLIQNGKTEPEYFDVTKTVIPGSAYNFVAVASPAAEPAAPVSCTLKLIAYDCLYNAINVNLDVTIVPAP